MRRPPALVFINPGAHGGRALSRLARVRAAVEALYDVEAHETDTQGRWRGALARSLARGVRVVIGAGGDGTVNAVAQALLDLPPALVGRSALGAIGLGSSNDFHKPLCRSSSGIPLRIDAAAAAPRDVVRVTYDDERGQPRHGIFLVSASLGVTASANAFFNSGDRALRALKGRWTAAAILYAGLRTAVGHPATYATLSLDGASRRFALANLSVLKSPHLAGTLTYDTPVDPASGVFAVNLLEHRGSIATLRAMQRLQRGLFLGQPGTHHWTGSHLEVRLPEACALELDGEVVRARRASFEVLPRRIRLCA
jgi:diacylglycerol kinase (ATP)